MIRIDVYSVQVHFVNGAAVQLMSVFGHSTTQSINVQLMSIMQNFRPG